MGALTDNLKGLTKDLLFTKGNMSMDVARSCAAGSILLYWGCVIYMMVAHNDFNPVNVGLGIASIFTASAGWIFMRQKQEGGPGDTNSVPGAS